MFVQSPPRTAAPDPLPLLPLAIIAAGSLWVHTRPFPFGIQIGAKVLPIVLLLLWAAKDLREDRSWYRVGITLGVAASLVGDVWIAFNFIAGIGAFFIAHLFYIAAMGKTGFSWKAHAAVLIPGAVLWGGMYQWLTPRVPAEMYIPVVAYLTVITAMWVRGFGRALAVRTAPAWLFFAGATWFVISDSLIAINRWVTPVPQDRLAIMATYYVAQWLIVRSLADGGFADD